MEHYRFCLRKLLISWKEWEGSVSVLPEHVAVAHMVIPWAAQVHRFGKAFIQIEKVGLEHEGHVLVRSALEYAVVGHWAAYVGHNAVVARYGADQRKLKALVNDMQQLPNDVVLDHAPDDAQRGRLPRRRKSDRAQPVLTETARTGGHDGARGVLE